MTRTSCCRTCCQSTASACRATSWAGAIASSAYCANGTACYFSEVDPAVLDGLQRESDSLRGRLAAMPARELVEQITNGMWVEPAPGMVHVELVPQYHLRPYNHDCNLSNGVILLYPADVLPPPADAPPPALLRLTRGLSDDSRLRILRFLSLGTRSLTEVARFAGLSQPTVHHHLAQLRSAAWCACTARWPGRSATACARMRWSSWRASSARIWSRMLRKEKPDGHVLAAGHGGTRRRTARRVVARGGGGAAALGQAARGRLAAVLHQLADVWRRCPGMRMAER